MPLVIDREHGRFDLLAHRHHLFGMIDAAIGAELADVDEPLDAGRDLDERTERLQPRHGAGDARALAELLGRVMPWVGAERL